MTFSFNAALSGLNANSTALSVTGNNIANANTIGFRASSMTFMDVFANRSGARLNGAGNSMQVGDGVQTGAIHTNFSQGSLNESSSPLHVAIQGSGYFVVKNADGSTGYTRAGDFSVSNKGYLVSSNGGLVQGYQAVKGVIPTGATLTELQIPLGQTLAPQVTSQGTFTLNLSATALTGSQFHTPMEVYDSLGQQRHLDLTYVRQADGSFNMTGTLDGTAVKTSVDGGAASAVPVNFTFDASGNLLTPTTLSILPDQTALGTAVLPSISINLRQTNPDGTPGAFNVTSFATADSAVASTTQDGYGPGELNGASVDSKGNIIGSFTNGQSRIVGQYALGTFSSEEGLGRAGGNVFVETVGSGQPTIGAPGGGGRGMISGGYLEQSNVNITNEFVSLIQSQRGFQANSKVITTLNQTMQDLLQII
jgi:flagellar hook protein FlgE